MKREVEVVIRVPRDLYDDVKRLAELRRADVSTAMLEALRLGVAQLKLDEAVRRYVSGEVSLGKAAELAEVSLWEFIDELRRRGIQLRYREEHVIEDLGGTQ